MKIVVPMAGRGSRLRPHTLTVPKPLVKVVGKPIVQRLVEDIASVCEEKIDEIAFIVGDFGDEVEKDLLSIADDLGAKGVIYHQDQPLGTAHAILCAKESLDGNVVVAFADTLFRADFTLDTQNDGIIWVQEVEDPSAFGVVKLDNDGIITDFIEKPKEYVSNKAIIGIYYFKEAEKLRDELQSLIDNKVIVNGEYQLTDALENLKAKNLKFSTASVKEWLDCGNKNVTVNTNTRYLEFIKDQKLVSDKAEIINSVIVPPVFIAEGAKIENAVVGPYVSIGINTKITNSLISHSIIQEDTAITNANITNSMVGSKAKYEATVSDVSIGDFCELKI